MSEGRGKGDVQQQRGDPESSLDEHERRDHGSTTGPWAGPTAPHLHRVPERQRDDAIGDDAGG